LLLHVVNLSGANAWPGYLEQSVPVGPLQFRVQLPQGFRPRRAELRCTGEAVDLHVSGDQAEFLVPRILDHEMVVLE
jgi:hypothetical protein